MSFPATRFALPHVGTAGNQGSHPAACAHPQICGLFWCRQLAYRSVRTHDVPNLQRRDFPDFPQTTAAPTNARTAHDPRTRQCSLSSRPAPGPVSTPERPTPAPPVPATLQSSTRPDRASVEADSAPRDAQSLLRNASRGAAGGQRLLRWLASTQQSAASTMLHYLRHCV